MLRHSLIFAALAALCFSGGEVQADIIYAIDFGTDNSPVASGFTQVTKDGAVAVLNTGGTTAPSITVEAISERGDANETSPGSPTFLTSDYIYDDRNNNAVGAGISGLPNGDWILEVWSWDATSNGTFGNQELEVHDGGTNVDKIIDGFDIGAMKDNPTWETDPAVTTTFTSAQANELLDIYLLNRIAGDTNQTRLNAIRLTQRVAPVPEPASIAIWSLIGLGLAGLGIYRRRRAK